MVNFCVGQIVDGIVKGWDCGIFVVVDGDGQGVGVVVQFVGQVCVEGGIFIRMCYDQFVVQVYFVVGYGVVELNDDFFVSLCRIGIKGFFIGKGVLVSFFIEIGMWQFNCSVGQMNRSVVFKQLVIIE